MAAFHTTTAISTTNTDILIYQVPNGQAISFTMNVCNQTAGNVKIGVSMSTNSTPATADYIEWNNIVNPGESFQRPGLVLGSNQYFFVRSDTAGVSVSLFGFVEND